MPIKLKLKKDFAEDTCYYKTKLLIKVSTLFFCICDVGLCDFYNGLLSRRDLHNYILRFYIHTPFWGLLLKYNVIRKL
jgi:hypothetical protein